MAEPKESKSSPKLTPADSEENLGSKISCFPDDSEGVLHLSPSARSFPPTSLEPSFEGSSFFEKSRSSKGRSPSPSAGSRASEGPSTSQGQPTSKGPTPSQESTSSKKSQSVLGGAVQTFKICANVDFMFPELRTLQRYQAAYDLGFRGVECANPYTVNAGEIAKIRNLKTVLINTPMGDVSKGQIGFASLPDCQHEFLEGFKKAIAYAKTLDCRLIHIMAGCNVADPIEQERIYVDNLRIAAGLLKDTKIVGVIEPINRHSVPNYYLSNYDQAVSVINAVGSRQLGLLLDIFHLQQIKGNLTRNITKYITHTKHIQVAQVPHRRHPGTDGEISYPYIFKLLNDLNYTGWVGLEYKPVNAEEDKTLWMKKYGLSFEKRTVAFEDSN